MKKRIKKIVRRILGFLLILLAIGLLYEQITQFYLDKNRPGFLSFRNINGCNIHFEKKGKGAPTVVFQSGLGGDYKIWEKVQDSISRYTTTISYDRAGLMWSDRTSETKTLANITSELEALLEKTDCPKPYILVGHSLAGITLRPFIKSHQKDISGIVFVDVAHPRQIKNASEELKKYLIVPPKWFMTALMETGIARIYFSFRPFISDLPKTHWMNRHIRDYFYRSYHTFLQEASDDDPMFEQAEAFSSFGDVPLTILTGAYPAGADFIREATLRNEYLSLHRTNQKDLLKLSTASRQVIARNSGHYVPLQDQDLLVEAIMEYLPLPLK